MVCETILLMGVLFGWMGHLLSHNLMLLLSLQPLMVSYHWEHLVLFCLVLVVSSFCCMLFPVSGMFFLVCGWDWYFVLLLLPFESICLVLFVLNIWLIWSGSSTHPVSGILHCVLYSVFWFSLAIMMLLIWSLFLLCYLDLFPHHSLLTPFCLPSGFIILLYQGRHWSLFFSNMKQLSLLWYTHHLHFSEVNHLFYFHPFLCLVLPLSWFWLDSCYVH